MSETKIYPVPAALATAAGIDDERYRALRARSLQDPDGFWAEQAPALSQLVQGMGPGAGLGLRGNHRPGRHQVVRWRAAERLLQLPGPTLGGPGRQTGDSLGRGRPGRG